MPVLPLRLRGELLAPAAFVRRALPAAILGGTLVVDQVIRPSSRKILKAPGLRSVGPVGLTRQNWRGNSAYLTCKTRCAYADLPGAPGCACP